MKTCHKLAVVPLSVLALACLSAKADELNTLEFLASETLTRDSNVFRLSDSTNTQALLGNSNRADTVALTSAGLKLHKSYGLQRVEFEVNAEDHHYSRYSNLDFTALNYLGALRWSVTPALHGNLTTDRREYVDNAADVQSTGQVNHRTDRSTALDAEYELGAAWRLIGGVFERSSISSQPLTFEGNSRLHGAEVGVRYVYASGTAMAYRFKSSKGDYPGRTLSNFFASNFRDNEHEFRLDWAPTGKTTVQARLARFERQHDGLPARDFSGTTGRAELAWAVTGKTSVNAGFASELGSYQTTDSSYFQGTRLYVGPTWKPTEKTAIRVRYEHGTRNFKQPLPGFAGSNRKDTTNTGSLAFEWQVLRALKLIATLQRDVRQSNAPGFDYKSSAVGVSALISF